jgi:hypothetical protein
MMSQIPTQNQKSLPTQIVKKYEKILKTLKPFLGELLDLIFLLKSGGYIQKEETISRWKRWLSDAEFYLEYRDLMMSIRFIHNTTCDMQLVIDRILEKALWENNPIPEALQKKFEEVAEASRKFLSILLDLVDRYTNINNIPPAVWAAWSDMVNRAYFLMKEGDLELGIHGVARVLQSMEPLLNELRNHFDPIEIEPSH